MSSSRRSSSRLKAEPVNEEAAQSPPTSTSPASRARGGRGGGAAVPPVKQERITRHFTAANGEPIRSPVKLISPPPPRRRSSRSKAETEVEAIQTGEEQVKVETTDEGVGLKEEDGGEVSMKNEGDDEEKEVRPAVQSKRNSQAGRKRGRASVKDEDIEEQPPKAALLHDGDEHGDADGDDDAHDWDTAQQSLETQLSYEQQRLENIRRNTEQMRLLQIPTLPLASSSTPRRRVRQSTERVKGVSMPQRRSLRNQGLDPEGNLSELKEGEPRYVPEMSHWVRPSRREGPVEMGEVMVEVRGSYDSKEEKEEEEDEDGTIHLDTDDTDKEAVKSKKDDAVISSICQSFSELTTSKPKRSPPSPFTPTRINRLQHIGMTNKLTKKRCTTMAFHPSSTLSRSILVSGDKAGQIGVLVYDDHRRLHDEGVMQCAFEPHAGGINSFCFQAGSHQLYSASNDGSVRHFSFDSQQFVDAFVNDGEDGLNTITSSSQHSNSLFTCDRSGDLIVLDSSSTSSLTVSSRTSLSHLKVNCVDVHPGGHLLASCGNDRTVRLWDLRRMKAQTPLHTFEHGYSVNSVYFSPTGSLLLSTSIDDFVRVWGVTGEDVGQWRDCVKIRHNNHTGRWVTLFRAKWTATDDAFLIGNMTRQVDVYGWDNGALEAKKGEEERVKQPSAYAMTSAELTAIPSVVVTHPSNEYFLAATASAYAYVWST